ncbi:MAG: aldo/keto reductase [Acidobacteriota bacterium]
MIQGYATEEGTACYRRRFDQAAPTHFRLGEGLSLSSIGIGTYLGKNDEATDNSYANAVRRTLALGCNVIDTAINYRCQRSERVIGTALKQAIEADEIAREEIFLSTKGGFIPFESKPAEDPPAYFQRTFLDTGVMEPDDLVAGCHCMTPKYLEHQLLRSRQNLGLETIDLYYIHNPETQLSVQSRETVYRRLGIAFAALEELVQQGWLQRYGIATWEALRTEQDGSPYLCLEELTHLARQAGGRYHHFRAVQLPVNLSMPEAFAHPNQPVERQTVPALAAARRLHLLAFASGSLHQGKLLGQLPSWLRNNLGADSTDAQRALQFARSCPGLTTALVGMSTVEHVEENLSLVATSPLTLQQLSMVLQQPPD